MSKKSYPNARAWCGTIHEKEFDNVQFDREKIQFGVINYETCPTTTALHMQCYLEFGAPTRLKSVKTATGASSGHFEPRLGTREQAIDYCLKYESRTPYTAPLVINPQLLTAGQGRRSDIKRAFGDLKRGCSDLEILEEHTEVFFKYQRGLTSARRLLAPRRDPQVAPEIIIYTGESGTGKTRKAIEDNPDAYIVSKAREGKGVWWQDYKSQKTIILDEFYGWVPYDLFLRICDRYPLEVEYKGGSIQLAATKIVITSNKPWQDWYKNIDDNSALKRRIKEFGTVWYWDRSEEGVVRMLNMETGERVFPFGA